MNLIFYAEFLLFLVLPSYYSQSINNTGEGIVKCAKRIIEKYTNRKTAIFLHQELSKNQLIDLILKKIDNSPRMILEKDNLKLNEGLFILFPESEDASSYDELLRNSENSKKTQSKFILIFPTANSSIFKLRLYFKKFWKFNYIDVIGLLMENECSINIYTFSPYSENLCNDVGKLLLLNTYDIENNRFIKKNTNLFPSKFYNMNKCPISSIGNSQSPDSIKELIGSELKFTGVGYKILQIMGNYFNFTPILNATSCVPKQYAWYYHFEELKNITRLLINRKIDLAFGWYSYARFDDDQSAGIELSRVSSIDCFGWAVPYRAGPKPANWKYYTDEFSYTIWLLIILVICLTAIIFHRLSSLIEERSSNFFTTIIFSYQTNIEQPHKIYQKSITFRLFFIIFTWYCLIITTAYKASFGSFMTVPSTGKEFVNMEDIIHSSLEIYGPYEVIKILNSTSKYRTEALNRFHVLQLTDFEQLMHQLIVDRDIAILGVKRFLYYNSLKLAKEYKVKIPFRFIPGCLLRAHTTQFMFKKGSHLTKPFDMILNRLFESGIIDHWILHLGSNKILPLERIKGNTLQLSFLKEPFVILIIGYFISFLIFIYEIFKHKRTEKITKIQNSLLKIRLQTIRECLYRPKF